MFEKELNTALQCYNSDFPHIAITGNQKNLFREILSILVPKIFIKTEQKDNKIIIGPDEKKIIEFVYVLLPILRKIDTDDIEILRGEIKALNNTLMISQEKNKRKKTKVNRTPKEYLIKHDIEFRRKFFNTVSKSKFGNGRTNYSKVALEFGIDPKTAKSWDTKYQKLQLR